MENWSRYEPKFRYMMLDRMRQDCDYSLNQCNGSARVLWSGDKQAQIDNMKALWNTFSEKDKPEWLTWEDILEYARKFGVE